MGEIANIYEVQYQAVSRWIDNWEDSGIRGLYKEHNGGRTLIYNPKEVERFEEMIKEEPRRISYVQSKLEKETGKLASLKTLIRMAKKTSL